MSPVLRLCAIVCFGLAVFSAPVPHVQLIPLGLAFWIGATFA